MGESGGLQVYWERHVSSRKLIAGHTLCDPTPETALFMFRIIFVAFVLSWGCFLIAYTVLIGSCMTQAKPSTTDKVMHLQTALTDTVKRSEREKDRKKEE